MPKEKDWKAEYERMKGKYEEEQKHTQYYANALEREYDRDREFKNRFRELVLLALERES